jgi:hypothetical protein
MITNLTYTDSLGECAYCDACGNLVPVSHCDHGEAECDYCLDAYGCDCE